MSDTVAEYDLNLPAGNGSNAVSFVAANLGWSDVEQVMLVFPPGCSGLVGVQLQYALNPVYPNASGKYYILDSYVLVIPVSNQEQGGQWRIAGYNADFYPHTVRAYFSYNYLTLGETQAASQLVSL